MRGWLRTSIRDLRCQPPSWREDSGGRKWYQLRGNKLFEHMVEGPVSDAEAVYTVLDMGENEDAVEVYDSIRAFVIQVRRDCNPAQENEKRQAAKNGDSARGEKKEGEEKGGKAEGSVENLMLYASSVNDAQLWSAAMRDATELEPEVPRTEAELVAWLHSMATLLRGTGAKEARAQLCFNATGLERIVVDTSPAGGNALHVAARFLGHDEALLGALCQASIPLLQHKDDTGALPLHILIAHYPHASTCVTLLYNSMVSLNNSQHAQGKGHSPSLSAPIAVTNAGATPLHTLARVSFSVPAPAAQVPGEAEREDEDEERRKHAPQHEAYSRKCCDTMRALIAIRAEALRETDGKGRLPLHVFARYNGWHAAGLRMLAWHHPRGASTACTHQGWLPLHYLARFHPSAHDGLALLRAIGGEDTLAVRSHEGLLAVHLLCRYGSSPASLRAILTPDTAKAPAPRGLTPLHLLAKHQATVHELVQVCLEISAEAALLAADDGSLPLHILARGAQAGSDGSVGTVLRAYEEGAVATDNKGLIPLQLIPQGSGLKWATREMLEAASLHVLTRKERHLRAGLRDEVVYQIPRDAVGGWGGRSERAGEDVGGEGEQMQSGGRRSRLSGGKGGEMREVVKDGVGGEGGKAQREVVATREDFHRWWKQDKAREAVGGGSGVETTDLHGAKRFEIETKSASYLVQVKTQKGRSGVRARGGDKQAGADKVVANAAPEEARHEHTSRGERRDKERRECGASGRGAAGDKASGRADGKAVGTSKEYRQRLKEEALICIAKLYGRMQQRPQPCKPLRTSGTGGREVRELLAPISRSRALSAQEREIAALFRSGETWQARSSAPLPPASTVGGEQGREDTVRASDAEVTEARIARRRWSPQKDKERRARQVGGQKRQHGVGLRKRSSGVQADADVGWSTSDEQGSQGRASRCGAQGSDAVWVENADGVWVPEVIARKVAEVVRVLHECVGEKDSDGISEVATGKGGAGPQDARPCFQEPQIARCCNALSQLPVGDGQEEQQEQQEELKELEEQEEQEEQEVSWPVLPALDEEQDEERGAGARGGGSKEQAGVGRAQGGEGRRREREVWQVQSTAQEARVRRRRRRGGEGGRRQMRQGAGSASSEVMAVACGGDGTDSMAPLDFGARERSDAGASYDVLQRPPPMSDAHAPCDVRAKESIITSGDWEYLRKRNMIYGGGGGGGGGGEGGGVGSGGEFCEQRADNYQDRNSPRASPHTHESGLRTRVGVEESRDEERCEMEELGGEDEKAHALRAADHLRRVEELERERHAHELQAAFLLARVQEREERMAGVGKRVQEVKERLVGFMDVVGAGVEGGEEGEEGECDPVAGLEAIDSIMLLMRLRAEFDASKGQTEGLRGALSKGGEVSRAAKEAKRASLLSEVQLEDCSLAPDPPEYSLTMLDALDKLEETWETHVWIEGELEPWGGGF